MMRVNLLRVRPAIVAGFSLLAFGSVVFGQTPELEQRRQNMNQSQENDRIRAGQEQDKKIQTTKEERTKLVNEAFRDLQLVHNEIVVFLTVPTASDAGTAKGFAVRARVAATALRDNLVLPGERKVQKYTKQPAEVVVNDVLRKINDLVKSFVKNINLSPKDPSAGAQAGRDLDEVILVSKRIVPETETSSKP